MDHFHVAERITHHFEGGFVDHPADPGGATQYGVSLRFLRQRGEDIDHDGDIDAEDIRALSVEDASRLFKEAFWDACQCDALPLRTACCLYDFAVNAGCKQAVRALQRACNRFIGETLHEDGRIGPKTIGRVKELSSTDEKELILCLAYLENRKHFYFQLIAARPSLAAFRKGWNNRVDRLTSHIRALP